MSCNVRMFAILVATLFVFVFVYASAVWAAIPQAAREDPRFALGYIVVTHYPGVRADGTGDSTAGIQQAIDDAFHNDMVVFFPPGEYLVSDTLKAYKFRLWVPSRNGLEPFNATDAHKLVGSTQGEKRPVIKLAPNAKGFDDPAKPRPVLAYRLFEATNSAGTRPAEPENTLDGVPENFRDFEAAAFGSQLRNIDFDLGGHAGAVGVVMGAAQFASLMNVRVDATNAYAGFFNIPGRDTGAVNIEVQGGRYGIIRTGGAGSVVVGARLIGQTESALKWMDFVPLTMVGFEISTDAAPAIRLYSGDWSSPVGSMSLIDGAIEVAGGGPAIDNTAGKNLYVRNVYVKGTDALIRSGAQATVTGGTGAQWRRIIEYAYNDQYVPSRPSTKTGNLLYEAGDKLFRSFSVIDGVVGRTPEPVVAVEEKAPPADLRSRHLPTVELPVYEGQADGTVVVTDFGAWPYSNVDSWQAIQQAIDTSPTGRVFIPQGTYYISRPLLLQSNTVLQGVSAGRTIITNFHSWQGGDNGYLIETVDDPLAKTHMGFLELRYNATAVAGALHWQAGADSGTINIQFEPAPGTTDQVRRLFHFSGNAGGRHYHLAYHQQQAERSSNPNTRGVYIEGTTQPLYFYGLNTEGSKGGWMDANVEIVDSTRIRIYNMKREGRAPTIIIRDSNDIGLFSMGRANLPMKPGSGGYVQIYGDSSDIVMSVLALDNYTGEVSDPMLREALHGLPEVNIAWPDNVSLYKRGDLPDDEQGGGPVPLPAVDFQIPERVVPGVSSPRIGLQAPTGVTVQSLRLYLDDQPVYESNQPLDSLAVDTLGLEPGRHKMMLEVVSESEGKQTTTKWQRPFNVAPVLEVESPKGTQVGAMPVGVRVNVPGDAVLQQLTVMVDGNIIFRNNEQVSTVVVDTAALADGRHELEIIAEMSRAGRLETHRATQRFDSDNYREVVDNLEPPIDSGWFGTVSQLLAIDKSAGWEHVTGDPESFWGDQSRLKRAGMAPEYLIWELPASTKLLTYRITLYVGDEQTAKQVSLAVSTDGAAWKDLLLTPQVVAGAPGRLMLELSGQAPPEAQGRLVRIQAQGAAASDELQLGQVYLKGIYMMP